MTQQSLITRLKAVEEALEYAECRLASSQPDAARDIRTHISEPLSNLRELIKEAEGQEPRAMPPKAHHATPFLETRIAELEQENAELRRDAERYRWLRNHNGELYGFGIQVAISRPGDPNTFWVHCDEGLDTVIDYSLTKIKEAS